MIDLSSSYISFLIVHKVGNKSRSEGCQFSSIEAPLDERLNDLILQNFLVPTIRRGEKYQFCHDSDLNLNVVNHYTQSMFSSKLPFIESSANLAKHLYSSSTHPNIAGGEFIIIMFNDIRTVRGSSQAIGLYRIEGKSDYLDIEDFSGGFKVVNRIGISLSRIQKGAVILSHENEVYVIDTLGSKTRYWIESFLMASPSASSHVCAKAAGIAIKKFSKAVATPGDQISFASSLIDELDSSEFISVGQINHIARSYLDDHTVRSVSSDVEREIGCQVSHDLPFKKTLINRSIKDNASRVIIKDGIELTLKSSNAYLRSASATPTEFGYRAVIDILVK